MQGSYTFDPEVPESVDYWDIEYESGFGDNVYGNATDHTGEIEDDFCRASKQYDSPLLNSKQGCGWKILEYVGEGDQDNSFLLKVYKPMGATKITIHGWYTPVGSGIREETKVYMDFTQNRYLRFTTMIITIALGNKDSLPEIYEHTNSDSVASISKFGIRSHELQINGSNFGVSLHDYMDPAKGTINGYEVRAIPNYGNIAMTRTFQKFFIGGYEKL